MSWALWTFSVRCHCVNLKVTLKLSARKHWIEMLSWHVCVFVCVCGREGGREVEKGSRQLSDIWFFLRNWYWDTNVFSYLANGDFGPWSKLRPERCQRRDLGNRAWIMEMCEKNMSTGCINICVTVINQISTLPSLCTTHPPETCATAMNNERMRGGKANTCRRHLSKPPIRRVQSATWV